MVSAVALGLSAVSRFDRLVEVHRAARAHDYEPPALRIQARSSESDDSRLRMLPAIGGRLGSAIPGTSPHLNTWLDRWTGRGG